MVSEHVLKKKSRPSAWLMVLIGALTLTAVAAAVFFGSWTYRETKKMATEQFNEQQLILARSAAASIEAYFQELTASLSSLVKQPGVQQMAPECLQCMQHTYWGFPPRTSIRLLDNKGVLRFIYPFEGWWGVLIGKDYSQETYFQEVEETGRISVKRVLNERGERRIRVAVPVYLTSDTKTVSVRGTTGMIITPIDPGNPESGVFQGVLIGSLDPKTIAQSFISPVVSGKTGYAWLLNEEGGFEAHYEEAFIGRDAVEVRKERNPDIFYEAFARIQRKMMAGEEGTGGYVSGWHRGVVGEIEKLVAYVPVHINDNTWSVAVCAPVGEMEEIIEGSNRSARVTLGLVILILIIGGGSLLAVSYHWSHVLEQVVSGRTREVTETKDYLNKLIRYANAPIIVWNPDQQVTMFNEAFERMSGRSEAEMKEQSLGVLFPEDRRADSLKKIVETSKGEHWETVEIPIMHKDGETRIALWNSANIYGEDGITLIATVAQGQDITERAQAVERIEHLNSVLKAIRSVNQLIVTEKDRDRLLQKACDVLIEARGYEAAWLGFSEDGESFATIVGSGLGEDVSLFREHVIGGDHPPCIENALVRKDPLVVVDRSGMCGDCFFKNACIGREAAILRVEHGDRLFGLLAVSLASGIVADYEEMGLLTEVAGDIAIGLHNMELAEARKQAEEEIRILSRFPSENPNPVLRVTNDGTIIYVNNSSLCLLNVWGCSIGQRLPDFLFQSVLNTLTPDPDNKEIETTCEGRIFSLTIAPVSDAGYVNVYGLDITERKLAEKVLVAERDLLQTLMDNMPDTIYFKDTSSRFTKINKAQAQVLGVSDPEDAVGKTDFDFFTEEHAQAAYEDEQKIVESGKASIAKVERIRRANGAFRWVSTTKVPIRDAEGHITGIVGLSRDITERKQAEEALKKAHDKLEFRVKQRTAELGVTNEALQGEIIERERAEKAMRLAKETAEHANRAKSDFLANMSHELRTPLSAIIGFSEILSDETFGEMNEKQSKYIHHVLTSGRHLLQLINDILDLSKIEAEKMELDLSMVEIKGLLENSLVMVKERAFKHGISLHLNIPDELADLEIRADERRLKQIMFNLLSNAAKFTPDGGAITVEVGQEKAELIVRVSDTGIGIKSEDQERVFGEFEQVDSSYARQQQGTGLGLALTRRLVELHGGRIRVESEGEGKGSTFTFVIPIEAKDVMRET